MSLREELLHQVVELRRQPHGPPRSAVEADDGHGGAERLAVRWQAVAQVGREREHGYVVLVRDGDLDLLLDREVVEEDDDEARLAHAIGASRQLAKVHEAHRSRDVRVVEDDGQLVVRAGDLRRLDDAAVGDGLITSQILGWLLVTQEQNGRCATTIDFFTHRTPPAQESDG